MMNKNTMNRTEIVKISQLIANEENPRYITKPAFEKLVKSILIFPRMLEIRPVVANDSLKILGGNMRLKALGRIAEMSEMEIRAALESLEAYQAKTPLERANVLQYWKEWQANPSVTIIRAEQLAEDEQREFIIKDNVCFGEWNFDTLANEWEENALTEWGMNLPQPEDDAQEESERNRDIRACTVEVICKDEDDAQKTYQELTEAGYECRQKNKK